MIIIVKKSSALLCSCAACILLLFCLAPKASFTSSSVEVPKAPIKPPLYENGFIVLMYHDLNYDTRVEGTIAPDLFESQMAYLKKNDFYVLNLEEMQTFLWHNKPIPPQSVMITFDDGYENLYRYAFPILQSYNFPAIVFSIVGTADEKYGPHLKWDQMRKMTDSGLISFQSHTYACHNYAPVDPKGTWLPTLISRLYSAPKGHSETETEYKCRIKEDLKKAKDRLEQKLETCVNALAFPYGHFNEVAIEIASSLGYKNFFTVKSGINRYAPKQDEPILIKRISAGEAYMTVYNLKRYISLAALEDERAGALFAATLK